MKIYRSLLLAVLIVANLVVPNNYAMERDLFPGQFFSPQQLEIMREKRLDPEDVKLIISLFDYVEKNKHKSETSSSEESDLNVSSESESSDSGDEWVGSESSDDFDEEVSSEAIDVNDLDDESEETQSVEEIKKPVKKHSKKATKKKIKKTEESKKFSCKWARCKKKYSDADKFYSHIRIEHLGPLSQKNCSCEWRIKDRDNRSKRCGALFKQKGNLKTHVSSHSKERPFKCSSKNCDRAFNQKGELNTHIARYHSD